MSSTMAGLNPSRPHHKEPRHEDRFNYRRRVVAVVSGGVLRFDHITRIGKNMIALLATAAAILVAGFVLGWIFGPKIWRSFDDN